MVNGVIGGLRTLFWAFVFLFVLVYILGVMMMVIRSGLPQDCGNAPDKAPQSCTAAERILLRQPGLFDSLGNSMFTVFRCLMGDCSTTDGRPLSHYLFLVIGPYFAMFYVLVICFVTF